MRSTIFSRSERYAAAIRAAATNLETLIGICVILTFVCLLALLARGEPIQQSEQPVLMQGP